MGNELLNPPALALPKGYSHAVKIDGSANLLILGGQVAWDREGRLVGGSDIIAQFDKALENILTVVREAGGTAESIVKLTIFVTDKAAYLAGAKQAGQSYRRHMGKHFPAMTLVEVKSLYEDGALIEIEGMAAL
jgi:enamine deaminase RidA (YjgF/YER057c/UK114 family)